VDSVLHTLHARREKPWSCRRQNASKSQNGSVDEGYDDARSLYNGMIDKRPRLIARCADVADVMTAVHFGRDNNLLVAIRGGGHYGPGLGSCDDAHLEQAAKARSELSLMHLYPIDGAVHRVGPTETAWNCRDATWSMVIAGIDPDPSNAGALKTWAKAYWEAVHPYTMGGAYVNFMMEEGEDRVKATYGDNYERLVEAKNTYDPTNLFRVNQNIKPTPQQEA